ncbi:Non-structural maintenance of chromosome element 4 [Gracilaria domingensis]|nr:Non-structural maintenance of chromosome element 4 [Gracilaria domingensis]
MSQVNQEAVENRRKATIVLKELREHQQQVDADKEEATDLRSENLKEHFVKSVENLQKAKTADQALVDAQIFHKLGIYSKRQAEQLQTGLRVYDIATFTDNLIAKLRRANADKYDEEDEQSQQVSVNFLDIGRSVFNRWRTFHSLDTHFGNQPKDEVRKVRERKRAERVKKGGPATKPNQLKPTDMEETETDKQVAEMKRELQRRKRCNFWLFVIDPNSFPRSVENVFHSSFLVKEKFASLDLKSEGEPMIRYINPMADEMDEGSRARQDGEEKISNSQFIMGFDRNLWQEMIRKHNIRKCLFPPKTRMNEDARLQELEAYDENGQMEDEMDSAAF